MKRRGDCDTFERVRIRVRHGFETCGRANLRIAWRTTGDRPARGRPRVDRASAGRRVPSSSSMPSIYYMYYIYLHILHVLHILRDSFDLGLIA